MLSFHLSEFKTGILIVRLDYKPLPEKAFQTPPAYYVNVLEIYLKTALFSYVTFFITVTYNFVFVAFYFFCLNHLETQRTLQTASGMSQLLCACMTSYLFSLSSSVHAGMCVCARVRVRYSSPEVV